MRVVIAIGSVRTVVAPSKLDTVGSLQPLTLKALSLALITDPYMRLNGAVRRTLIGIMHCLACTTLSDDPSQFAVFVLHEF